MHTETDGQNEGIAATPPHMKPASKKPASAGTPSKETAHAALEEEQRKAAAAQAAVEDLQRQLAVAEAALAEERQKAAAAQQLLSEQRRAAVTHAETFEQTAEQMPGEEAAFGLMPLVGFRGTDLFNISQQVVEQAIKQPPLALKHYTNFLLEMGRLMTGLTHMLEDLANNGGMPSQVNMKAFQIGKDLGISPGAVVFKNEVLELIQYQPTTPQVYQRPLLIVPPQVNKFYVMDLSPSKSIIRYLVANGQQVFAISWRNPTPQQRAWGFETYDQAILEAIEAVRAITESPDVNITGSCLGGMTLSTLLGHLAARGAQRIHAVTFLVTVLDTSVESTMGLFATKETIAAARENSRLKG